MTGLKNQVFNHCLWYKYPLISDSDQLWKNNIPLEGANRNKIEFFFSIKSLYTFYSTSSHYYLIFLHNRRHLSIRSSYTEPLDLVNCKIIDLFLIKNTKMMMGANRNKRILHYIESTSMFHYTHFMYQR